MPEWDRDFYLHCITGLLDRPICYALRQIVRRLSDNHGIRWKALACEIGLYIEITE